MENKYNLYAYNLDSIDEYGCVIVAAATSKEAFEYLSGLIRYKRYNIYFDKQLIGCITDNTITEPKIVYKSFIKL
jgi:disulfide oxidoreductase YuzD